MGSSSGLIIAFVVAVWAAYFVPLVLRRYDEASKNASVESPGSLGRVISRPVSSAAEPVAPAPAATVVDDSAATPATSPTADRPAARLAAKRRRRTLLTLLAVLAVVGGLAAAGVIAPVWIAAPVALVVAWLVACRIQVRGELGLSSTGRPRLPNLAARITAAKPAKAAKPERAPRPLARDEEETIVVSGQIEDINPGLKHQMESVELEADALDDKIVIAVPSVSTTGEALWDPLPVTLPTYVTKPRAGRTVRTIDFGQAGTWTSGHIEGEDVELPGRAAEPGDERRAVGH